MNTTPPLLPEATFKPLSPTKLEAMIDTALTFQQLPAPAQPKQAQIITFRSPWLQNAAFGSGMLAMAASIMLAFLLTPQLDLTPGPQTTAQSESTTSADIGDLLLLDGLGA